LAIWDVEDLKLWIDILTQASQEGIDINRVTYTKPSDIGITDACETCLGGFTQDGQAWRWKIPQKMYGKLLINLLKFIAAVVNIWWLVLRKGKGRIILNFTDNSGALVCLHKSSFNPITHKHHNIVARKLARILLDHESTLYSQHIKGSQNVVGIHFPVTHTYLTILYNI
jgi:hypothetical protein